METAITALIIIAVLMLSIFALAERSLNAQATIAESTRQLQERAGERARTNLMPIGAKTTDSGNHVEVTLRNTGGTKLADFNQWDVILQYTDVANGYHVEWYSSDKWTEQIYLTTLPLAAEVFEPGILNPGEEMVMTINVSPGVRAGTANLATLVTPNGIRASAVFTN
jgi:archaellum component FlaF (FlaF/FlaG flagellin family)